ncbi:hypothetical protein BGX31_003581, partial [Mortierella sp. GBA43]
MTLVLILRQKSGKTMRAVIESTWIIFATAMWILAAIGGIAKPPNGMSNVSCKVLPDGTNTSDANYMRACQAMFASTAFCIMTALLFIVTALMIFVFSVKSSIHDWKNRKKQVGGHYKLEMTPSQYRRAQKEDEESKTLSGAGEHEEESGGQSGSTVIADGHFSARVYHDPVISTPPPATSALASEHYIQQQQQHHQQQQQQQEQLQQQQSLWVQQPAFGT